MKKIISLLLTLILAVMTLASGNAVRADGTCDGSGINSASDVAAQTIVGSDRYETGRQMALAYAGKKGTLPTEVILVTGEKFPDALAANALAGIKDCPILLSNPSALSDATERLLRDDWGKNVKTVTLVGAGFSDALKSTLKNDCGVTSIDDTSFAGATRYETAELVAEAVTEKKSSQTLSACLITTGEKAADALSASSFACREQLPILLADSSGNISDTVRDLADSYDRIYILGGTSVVSESVESSFGSKAVRIGGSTRYETSLLISQRLSAATGLTSAGKAVLAMGEDRNFPDALVAGPYAAVLSESIILISNYGITDDCAASFKNASSASLIFVGAAASDGRPDLVKNQISLGQGALTSLQGVEAGTILSEGRFSRLMLDSYFSCSSINVGDAVYNRIINHSYPSGCSLPLSSLRYLKVLHVNYDGQVQVGEMITNSAIASDVLSIFRQLFNNSYQIRQMYLVEKYWTGDASSTDLASVSADNTACFNYRQVTGGGSLSNHALGLAVDVNPRENPYVIYSGNTITYYEPSNAAPYLDRSTGNAHYITGSDLCSQLFAAYGFSWGGNWASPKDYQHFERT